MAELLSDLAPAPANASQRVDIRRAMAGIYFLQGRGSMLRCAVMAGFSRKTARCLTQNGLSAEQCIQEAAKLDPMVAPAKLLQGGRRVLAEQIAFRDPQKMAVRDAVKLFEATEKYFGGHELPASNTLTSVADRLSQVAALLAVAQRRGLPVPRVDTPFLDAEIIATNVAPNEQDRTQRPIINDSVNREINKNW